ncbi:MAG: hypothetical protein LBI98_01050 [Endomicrobium sp.]|nr:hypothetical protein [Endomicrobium sp.]
MIICNNLEIYEPLFKFKRIIAFVALLASALLFNLSVSAFEINITASNLEYGGEQADSFSVKGNVAIEWEGKKMYADYIEFFLKEKIINAQGNVKIKEPGSVVYADSTTYNYDKKSGSMKEIFGYSSSVFVRAEYIEGNENEANMNNVRLSSCDLDNPHIYFKVKRGEVVLNKRVTIHNAILYINKIPVFYIPIFTKSLNEEDFLSKLKMKPMLFYSKKGLSLRTTFSYPLTKSLACMLAFEPFAGKVGWNGSFKYKTENAHGTIHVCHDADDNKLRAKFNYFQVIDDDGVWVMRSNATAFYNFCSLSDYNNYKRFCMALTRQKDNSNLSIGFVSPKYNGFYDTILVNDYKKMFLIRPKISFTYYPRDIFWGIMHKFRFAYDTILYNNCNAGHISSYASRYSLYNESTISDVVHLSYSLTRSFNFLERFTLKPTLEMFGNQKDELRRGVHDAFIVGCFGCLNLRFRVTDWIDFDLNYCLREVKKNRKNVFNSIDNLSDNGYGSNGFSLVDYIHIGDATIVKNFFQIGERQLPFITEITWNPKSFIIAYLKQSQLLYPFKTDYFQVYSKIGKLNKSYLNFNIFYKDNKISNILGFGLCLGPKWRFDYNMEIATKSKLSTSLLHFKMTGVEFKIYRNLHCYNLGIHFRMEKNSSGHLKPGVFFQLSTKTTDMFFNKENKKGDYFKDFKGMPKSWLY